jgi:uncharacterized protein (TIGR02265 family)
MDALLKRCARELPPEGWAALAGLGVERDKRLPAYEFTCWCETVAYLARALYPSLEVGEAEYRLGSDFIERYAHTLIGRALFTVLRLLGPRRVLGRMARSFRTGTNFTQADVIEETATSALLRIASVEPRARFTHGILARGLALAGIPAVQVRLESIDGDAAFFRVSW